MKRILLTGATGNIGRALLPVLLAEPGAEVLALVRERAGAAPAQRLGALRADPRVAAADPAGTRLHAVPGDITLPRLGLDQPAFDALARGCTHVVHAAASVKLNMTAEQARATALEPTLTVLDLALRGAEAGTLRKLEMVSTVGVWGRTPGELPEQPVPEVATFHNTYEAAKAEAERAVWQALAAYPALPVTVHRPSMVVGDSHSGEVASFQIFYHLCEFLSGVRTGGLMPRLGDARLDVVPADWVAGAIGWACLREQAQGEVLNLASGAAGSVALTDLQARVRGLWRAHGRRVPVLKTLPRAWFVAGVPVLGALAGARARKALAALPAVLSYLAHRQSFANERTVQRLAAAGLPLPPAEGYLDVVLARYLDHLATTRP